MQLNLSVPYTITITNICVCVCNLDGFNKKNGEKVSKQKFSLIFGTVSNRYVCGVYQNFRLTYRYSVWVVVLGQSGNFAGNGEELVTAMMSWSKNGPTPKRWS